MTALFSRETDSHALIDRDAPIDAASGVSRRIFLKAMGALGVTAALPNLALAASGDDQESQAFQAVSRFLTQKTSLPDDLSRALMIAFKQFDDQFPAKLSALRDYIDQRQLTANEPILLSDVAEAQGFAELPQQILSAWYLGVVGSGDGAICVTYVNALAYQTTADKLRPPSYAYGAYGSWATKPV